MRVYTPSTAGYVASASLARRSAGGTFAVAGQEAPRAAASLAPPRALASIDALIALQGFDELGERRRRAIKRGRTALDALDALKIGLLAGALDAAALT